MAHSLVSVIIPCRNASPWIADAIQSALAQTYSPVEVIVIDDGSIDGSREIIQSFKGHIQFEFLEHGGAPNARNKGLRLASGEFIQFLDADDILFPHCLTRKIQAFLGEGADIVYSGGFFFDLKANKGNYESQAAPQNGQAAALAHIIASTIVTTLLMCRRTCLERVGGFNEQLVMGQEHDLLIRMAREGFKTAYVPEALSLNRIGHNPQSITSLNSQNPYYMEELFNRFGKMIEPTPLWTSEVRKALAWRFHLIGVQYLVIHKKSQAIKMFHKAEEMERRYTSYLSFPRHCLVPYIGGYLTEKYMSKLRQIFPRPS